jgi:hypothetical protein
MAKSLQSQASSPNPIYPSAKPSIAPGQFLNIKSPPSSKITVRPSATSTESEFRPKEPAFFRLSQNQNKLLLSFETTNKKLFLLKTKPIVIHLVTASPVTIDPSIITTKMWPQTGKTIVLKITQTQPGQEYRITGKATFTYCHQQTKACKAALVPLLYYYRQN